MGVLSAWQKRGPGLLPRRLQYRSMNFTGQNGEDSSPGMSKRVIACIMFEMGDCDLNRVDFPTGCEESGVIVRNYGSVTRAPGH